MIFYFSPNSCALASHIALETAGADYEARRLDFSANEQRSRDYMQVNPKGRVPTLITQQGTLTETPAILAYICQLFPEAGLAPLDDPFRFAELQAFNSYLCSTVHVAHAHRLRGRRWVDDEAALAAMQRNVPYTMAEYFGLIEREMFRGPYVFGTDYTVSDMYLFTISRWLEGDGVDIARFPKVAAHLELVAQKPEVETVLAVHRSQ